MTRAWFRRRVDADPRRWVLLLAALEGISVYSLKLAERADAFAPGPAIALWFAVAAIAPAAGVMGMLVHGRLLWWTGALLGGRARPEEIHAAFAWSELPFVVAAAPLVLTFPVRAAAALLEPTPPALQRALGAVVHVSDVCVGVAAIAGLGGAVLYVRYLAEAQGFGPRRAIVNHVLAVIAGLALLAAGIAAAMRVIPGSNAAVYGLVGSAAAAALAIPIEITVRRRARRREHGSPPPRC